MEWAETLAPYLRHIHVHDNDGSRDQHLACGRGAIPIREILTMLTAPQEDGTVRAPKLDTLTVESMTAEDAKISIEFVREVLSGA